MVTASYSFICYPSQTLTTRYTSDKMKSLDGPAKEAGVVIVNELGLDPGIDHMACMSVRFVLMLVDIGLLLSHETRL